MLTLVSPLEPAAAFFSGFADSSFFFVSGCDFGCFDSVTFGSGRDGCDSLLATSGAGVGFLPWLPCPDATFSSEVGSGFALLPDEPPLEEPPGASLYRSCPTVTVSSSFAKISTIVPDLGALMVTSIYVRKGRRTNSQRADFECEPDRSRRTLSVSILAISSSASTWSPTFFIHVLSVPSEIDSAICGTWMVSGSPAGSEAGCLLSSSFGAGVESDCSFSSCFGGEAAFSSLPDEALSVTGRGVRLPLRSLEMGS